MLILILMLIPVLSFSQEQDTQSTAYNNAYTAEQDAQQAESQDFIQNRWAFMFNPPYNFYYGYLQRINDFEIYLPYAGIGLYPTQFSSSWMAVTGVSMYYKRFTWKLEYFHGFVPDMSLLDFKNIEYFGQMYMSYDFYNLRLSSLTKYGRILYAKHSANDLELEQNAHVMTGLQQIISLDYSIYNDDIITMTGYLNLGIRYIQDAKQLSYYAKSVTPLTFNFINSSLGFMTTLFYTDYIGKNRET